MTEDTAADLDLPGLIAASAEDLPVPEDPAFGPMFERFADRRVVLLGEASHGTSEFYRARAAITRHLVAECGFDIVAVEADWPDAAAVDRHVRDRDGPAPLARPFDRFPSWMWRNTDVAAFVEWLREHNSEQAMEERAGFFGLDIYNLSASIEAVLAYLDEVDPQAAATARERYACLAPWEDNPAGYGRETLARGYAECEAEVVAQCRDLLQRNLEYRQADGDSYLDATQNARLIASAERYYRIMYYGGPESWNLRDTHMFETLENLLEARGPDSKAVVWAHNSHIGDASQTAMGKDREEVNVGQLCRERFGRDAALIGFGTHSGAVAAASDWSGPMEVKEVLPSRPDSQERLFHEAGLDRALLDMGPSLDPALERALAEPRPERFIGVIYRPETEFASHYAETVLPRQFDAYVWFDETSAVTPLGPEHHVGMPDTYPFGE